jgi:hypothetical protein
MAAIVRTPVLLYATSLGSLSALLRQSPVGYQAFGLNHRSIAALRRDSTAADAMVLIYTVTICIWNPGGHDVHTRSANGTAGGG